MYNLEWWIGSTKKETILWNKPKALVNFTKRKLESTTHRTGILKITIS